MEASKEYIECEIPQGTPQPLFLQHPDWAKPGLPSSDYPSSCEILSDGSKAALQEGKVVSDIFNNDIQQYIAPVASGAIVSGHGQFMHKSCTLWEEGGVYKVRIEGRTADAFTGDHRI